MKKLMFAAALATVSAAFAIESKNIVGYAGNTLRENFSYVTPQFQNVTGGNMNLQDIVCNDGCDDAVQIMILADNGVQQSTYCWTEFGGPDSDKKGWYDAAVTGPETLVTGISFIPGQAFCVQGLSSNQTLTTAGMVGTEDTAFQLRANFSFTGNSSPVQIDLQDVVCSGEGCDDAVQIMILADNGVQEATYCWTEFGGPDGDKKGWYDAAVSGPDTLAEGVKFAPGQGLCVQGISNEQYITFPCADL